MTAHTSQEWDIYDTHLIGPGSVEERIREESHVSGSFLRWEHRKEGSGFDRAQTSAWISYHFPAGASGKELAF